MTSLSKPLILLASASPRRSALLKQVGVPHEVQPVDIDETVRAGESPAEYVYRLARAKAETAWERFAIADQIPVLGADTTVALRRDVLGKPVGSADLLRMLRRLSGETHQVYTAIALRSKSGMSTKLSVTDVTFRPLRDAEILAYWETGEPADKAGGYAVQGRGALFIEHIHGSYSGVVGLPLFETAQLLEQIGWNGLEMAPPIAALDSQGGVR